MDLDIASLLHLDKQKWGEKLDSCPENVILVFQLP